MRVGMYRKQYEERRSSRKKLLFALIPFVCLLGFVLFALGNSITLVVPASLAKTAQGLALNYGITHLSVVRVKVVPDEKLTSTTLAKVMKEQGAKLCLWPHTTTDGLPAQNKSTRSDLADLTEVAKQHYDHMVCHPMPPDSSQVPDKGFAQDKSKLKNIASLPVCGSLSGFIYNSELFKKRNIVVPQSPTEVASCAASYANVFPQGIGMYAADKNGMSSLGLLVDAGFVSADGWKKAASEFLHALYAWTAYSAAGKSITPAVPQKFLSRDEVLQAFKDKKLAGFVGTSYDALILQKRGSSCEFVSLSGSTSDQPPVFYPRYLVSALRGVSQKEQNFITWLFSADAQNAFAQSTFTMPAVHDSKTAHHRTHEVQSSSIYSTEAQHEFKALLSSLYTYDAQARQHFLQQMDTALQRFKEELS